MIAGVRGILEARGPDWVQVLIGGSVSFQVSVPASTIEELGDIGDEVHLYTRLYVRDDEAVLYGFSSPEALSIFQMLNGVSGIGPRTSLAVLSTLGPQTVIEAIGTGDLDSLSRVPGVGKKSAGRMVLELSGKFSELVLAGAPALGGGDDGNVISALMALGYTATESRRTLASLDGLAGQPLEEKVRRALQQLAAG